MIFCWRSGRRAETAVVVESVEVAVGVVAGALPAERLCAPVGAILETKDPRGEVIEVSKAVGGDGFTLQDREVDLDLAEPGGVNRKVHQHHVGRRLTHQVNRGLTCVGGALADNPEHSLRAGVGLGGFYLLAQLSERQDPGLGRDAAYHADAMDGGSGDIGQRPTAAVLELQALGLDGRSSSGPRSP